MHRVTGGIEFTIDDDHEEVADYSYGEDERNPAYESTWLFVTPMGDFYLLGGGGEFSLWGRVIDDIRDFDCGRRPISPRDALAWAGRYCPASLPRVAAIIAGTRRGTL